MFYKEISKPKLIVQNNDLYLVRRYFFIDENTRLSLQRKFYIYNVSMYVTICNFIEMILEF